MREYAALQVVVKRLLHIARQRPFVGIMRMVQKRAEVLPYEVVKDCPLGATRFVMRAREGERRPSPRRRIAATCLRLASHQHGSASWRGLCQPWIVSFQVLGAGDPGGPRIPPWRRQVRGVIACCCGTDLRLVCACARRRSPQRWGLRAVKPRYAPIPPRAPRPDEPPRSASQRFAALWRTSLCLCASAPSFNSRGLCLVNAYAPGPISPELG